MCSISAPIRPQTSETITVRQVSDKSIDKKREIAVLLDRETFLCSTTNGVPTMWAIIVAEDKKAQGLLYF